MKKPTYLKSVLIFAMLLCSVLSYAQNNYGNHVPFKPRFDQTLKGDILLIGNNILNRNENGNGNKPNDPYYGDGQNGKLDMQYIDIDNDNSTFSSSSADLTVPTDCYKIVYAGLYWAGISYEDNRSDLNKVKFKVPNGSYEDLTGELIYDAVNTPIQNTSKSYACYADVTSQIQALADPEGTYMVGNVTATTGNSSREDIGTSAGWSLFIVYEDPVIPGKAIVSFDGFSAIGGQYVLDVPIQGFKTIPVGPVRAKYAFSTLEGDKGLSGDYLKINGTRMFAPGRANDNFFNSSVTTISGTDVRNPNSTNTLGYDAGIIEIDNPGNSIIANGDTDATITLGTEIDVFHFYFNAFAVEIIQPDINVTKIVEDAAGNNINDGDVTLGQELEYVLQFQNTGNDDAINYSIKDVLPINVNFLEMNLEGAPGVTYTYDEATHTLNFQIPDNLVEEKDPVYEIRIKVRVIEECYKLRDACSNIIQNLAYSTYYSETSGNIVGNENPSVSGIGNCGLTTPGSTNFLVDIDGCTFEREEVLCSSSMQITAGDGYKSYQWYKGTPGNGTPLGNTQTITVTEPGIYTSVNTTDQPCISITETVNVILFGADLPNPILPYADKVLTCPDDNSKLPVIYLCGEGDTKLLESNITDAESIVWEKLNEGSCNDAGANCANKNTSCTWTEVGSEANYTANQAGEFRLRIIYQSGCFVTFYFNVYKNLFTPTETHNDIICDTQGNITVLGVPDGYEFSISGPDGPYQDSNSFDIATAGNYTVYIRPQGLTTEACIFTIPNIPIRARDFTVDVIDIQPLCATDKGAIRIQINDVDPQYYYKIVKGNSVLNEVGPIDDNDYRFDNLNAGDYTVSVTTADGCTYSENVTITNPEPLTVSAALTAPVGCANGEVTITASGGTPPYFYYINNETDYRTNNVFNVDSAGTYTIQVFDSNNCEATTQIEVSQANAPSYTISKTDNTCADTTAGSITVNVDNSNGYTLEYSIDNGTTFQTSNVFSNLTTGDYDIVINYTLSGATCTLQDTVSILGSSSITGEAVLIQEYNCNQDASIQAQNVSGGTPPNEYSLDGVSFQNSETFSGLTAGTYAITIRDANGCTFTTNEIKIEAVNAPQGVTFTSTEVSCDTPNASVTLNVNGSGTYQYEITAPVSVDNGTNNVFSDLAPGTYTFLITNDKGCSLTDSYTIESISPVTVEGTVIGDVTCVGTATGEVTFTVAGFETSYSYSVNGGTTITGETQTSLNFNYGAGTYTIEVTDETTNCKASASVTVSEADAPLATSTPEITPMSCNTDGSVTLKATGGTGTKTYTLTLPNGTTVGPQNNPTFNGLNQSGNHTYTVTDVTGCSVSDSFNLQSTTAPVATLDVSSDLCFNNTTNSTIVVSVTGGTAPYTYSINGSAFQTGNTFSGLTPGDYTIDVLDANGCPATALTQTIAPQLVIDAVLIKNLDCTTNPDAEIRVTVTGGASDFTYQVSKDGGNYSAATAFSGTEFTYNAATAGTYTFLIKDSNNCTIESTGVIVDPKPILNTPDINVTQGILCNGDNSGAITITPSGGLPPYTISIENDRGVDFGDQTSGLFAGNYTAYITDANSCTVSQDFTITEPDAIAFDFDKKDITCEGYDNGTGTQIASTGQITIKNVSGGSGDYTYYVTNNFGFNQSYVPAAGEDHTFIVIDYGIYSINVVDSNGCALLKENITIASPPEDLDIDVDFATTDCNAGGTAVVSVVTPVSSGNYQFAILEYNTPPYSDNYLPADAGTPETKTFTGLTPGVLYTFVVFDGTSCYTIKSSSEPINTLSNLTATIDAENNISCTGSGDGNVSFTFGNYAATTSEVTYEIFHAHSNVAAGYTGSESGLTGADVTVNNFGMLEPGEYYILFKEVGGCSVASKSFNIIESSKPLELSATITKNDNCNYEAGVITAQAQYGTAPYKYLLLPAGSPTPDATAAWVDTKVFHVEGGNYDIYAMDVFGCIKQTSATISLPTDTAPTLTLTVDSNTICGEEGNFTLVVTRDNDGVAPFTYSVNGSAFKTYTEDSNNAFELTNLNSGEHTIVLKDANGCTSEQKVTIYPPLNGTATPTISATPDCNTTDGIITVNAVGGSGNYSYSISPAAGSLSGGTFSGLAAGNYTVTITDVITGCVKTIDVEIPAGTPVTFDITNVQVDNVTCNGNADGSITVKLPNNQIDLPYTYTLTGTTPVVAAQSNTTGIFEGLAAGDYTITVISARNCEAELNVTITEPGSLSATASATEFACATNNTTNASTLTVDANGGTTPYYYSINGTDYFETNTFQILDNGTQQTIQIYVKDANGCEVTTSVTLEPLPDMDNIQIDQVDAISCNNGERIVLTINDNPPALGYTYQLLPSGTPQSSNEFILTEPGTYTFKMTNNVTGCYAISEPYTVNPYDTIETSIVSTTDVLCYGDYSGSVTINITGYNGTYTYGVRDMDGNELAPAIGGTVNPFQDTLTINNLPAGNFYVEITETEKPFCSTNTPVFNISGPDAGIAVELATTSPTCTNDLGTITALGSGGTGVLLYEFSNVLTNTVIQAASADNSIEGLAAGTYSVKVTDESGCEFTSANITLDTPAPINADIFAAPTALSCIGDANAVITVENVTGGQGNGYLYTLVNTATGTSSGPQPSNIFSNIAAGTYYVIVSDGWNCEYITANVTITEPADEILGTLTLNASATCATDASITLSVSGGTAPYQYSTDGTNFSPLTNPSTFNVAAGAYQYYIKDANDCDIVLTNKVAVEPVYPVTITLDLSAATVSCVDGSNAVIIAEAKYGTGDYSYELIDVTTSSVVAGPQTSGTFKNLAAGTYQIMAYSGSDCSAASQEVTISNPAPLDITYTKTDISCNGENDGSITITATGGTGTIQYAISPNLKQFVDDNTFTDLAAGTYQVYVQDQSGCFQIIEVTITEPETLTAEITATQNEQCLGEANGSITVKITGGTAPFSVRLDGNSSIITNFTEITGDEYTFTNLSGDIFYQVYVTDSSDCTIENALEFYMDPAVEINPTVTIEQVCSNNGPQSNITINVNDAVLGSVQYSIDGTTFVADNTFTNVPEGNNTAYVLHNNGCLQTVDFFIDTLEPIAADYTVTSNVLCFGEANGEIVVNATGGTGNLQYAISPDFNFQSSNTFSNITAGIYEIMIKDEIGCELVLDNIVINEPTSALTANATPTSEICYQANDGTITVDILGGTAPYQVSLDNTNFVDVVDTQHVFTDLEGGIEYTVYVKDANGCEITPVNVTIDSGVIIEPQVTVDDTCTNNTIGNTVTVNVNTAIENEVQFSLDNTSFQTSNVFSNLAAGTYTVYVKHNNGCVAQTDFSIDALTPITATADVTSQVLCFGAASGEVTVTANGGSGNYQYAISPDYTYNTSNSFTNLTAGSYTIKVMDTDLGCETEVTSVIISEPASALSASASATSEVCYQANDGTITVDITGGTAPYEIKLNDGSFVTVTGNQHVFTALEGATEYTIYVKDANACEITPVNVTVTSGAILTPTVTIDNTCNSNTIGNTVTITMNNEVKDAVQFSIDGVTYQTSNVFTDLAAGTYTLSVKHDGGCITDTTFTIEDFTPIAATATVTSDVLCFGDATGAIEVNANGGSGNYQYAISPDFNYGPSNTFSDLAAGNYTIKVLDTSLGCEIEVTGTVISQPASQLNATASATGEVCYDAADASITVNIFGGTAPYEVSLNGGAFETVTGSEHTFTALQGGMDYEIVVKDANGCEIVPISLSIGSGIDFEPTVDIEANCTANAAGNIVTVTVDEAVQDDVTYALNNGSYSTNNIFTNLAVGTHTVAVKHTNGCIKTVEVVIDPTTAITANVEHTEPLCAGDESGTITITNVIGGQGTTYTYAISPDFAQTTENTFSNLAAGTYTVRVYDELGCYFETTETVSQPTPLQVNVKQIFEEDCGNDDNGAIEIEIIRNSGTAPYFTSLEPDSNFVEGQLIFDQLDGGKTYTIYVKDANGCMTSVEATLAEPINIVPEIETLYSCEQNITSLILDADVMAESSIFIDGEASKTGGQFMNLASGTYEVEVQHISGCTATVNFTINNALPLSLDVEESNINEITATVTGGSGNYTYTFNGVDYGSNNVYRIEESGIVYIVATDELGCQREAQIEVTKIDLEIVDFFTPDENGENDTWGPINSFVYPNIVTKIFDRYGREVSTLKVGENWDGKYNGNNLPTGDYWYIINLHDSANNKDYVGHFTLYR
ncbi:T9SS type B sorting domain-containing protein [Formosa sp. S-31]|uniref:T9SS type B sorting domain-containing protein n=1 Tax=Formosa sp. S-31 TaxID=2790949 RepID=UPI003EBF0352